MVSSQLMEVVINVDYLVLVMSTFFRATGYWPVKKSLEKKPFIVI
jgi:hypothetical protein